jgi:hypothetical protein
MGALVNHLWPRSRQVPTAYVIETGQEWPASTCDQTNNPAARAT